MSHLIIEQGIDVGKEVAVPPAGMKFGRSPANDLVLDDDAVMLFHGRFFFKSDGSLWVTDFGAANKTTVDGEPVDEFQLSVGNLIEVGHTGFRVIKASQEEESASVANDAAGHGHIDLGFKREKKQLPRHHKKEKRSTFSSRLLQVLVVLMVLVVLLIVGPSLLELSKKEIAVAPQEETLLMAYERVQADTRNIFRYYLELTANGEFSIQIDDLKNDRHVSKKKQISETIRLQLSNSIEEAGFFDVDSDYAGEAPDQYDLHDIAVSRNRRFHRIKVLNRSLPLAIKRTKEVIEDFARSELGISFTWNLSVEELMKLAEESYSLGQARFAERDVRYGNLAAAIKHFEEAQLYLETIEPKPQLDRSAADGLRKANEIRNERYEDYMFRAEKEIRMKNWESAAKHLRILSELIPDRSDERYDTVNSKLLNVEQHLK